MAKRISLFAILLLLTLSMTFVVCAHEVPDMDREDCSITVTMRMGDRLVSGGVLQLFYVGAVQQNNGDYCFVADGDFRDCGLDYGVLDGDLAKELRELALDCEPMREENVGEDARVLFDGLKTGLYLVVQRKPGAGYTKAEPFLVSVPYYDKTTLSYDYSVDANPKVGGIQETKPSEPTQPKPPKLPQTGQTKWPVPVLLVGGIGLMLLGILLRCGRKTDEYET